MSDGQDSDDVFVVAHTDPSKPRYDNGYKAFYYGETYASQREADGEVARKARAEAEASRLAIMCERGFRPENICSHSWCTTCKKCEWKLDGGR